MAINPDLGVVTKILKQMQPNMGEMGQMVARQADDLFVAKNVAIGLKPMGQSLNGIIDAAGVSKRNAKAAKAAIAGYVAAPLANQGEAFQSMSQALQKHLDPTLATVLEEQMKMARDQGADQAAALASGLTPAEKFAFKGVSGAGDPIYGTGGLAKYGGAYAKAYFGDAEYGKTRKAVVSASAAALVAGRRFGSGGDLTHDGYGNPDIIGVPFV